MEEQQPLIDDDADNQDAPTSDIKRLMRRNRNRPHNKPLLHPSDISFGDGPDGSNSTAETEDENAPDNVTCVFVIAFDTRQGNMLEWSMPEDVELDGVEFKAMPSGAHTIPSDFFKLLQCPGNYEELKTFYDEKKGVLCNTSTTAQTMPVISSLVRNTTPSMKITHPIGSFTLLVRFFGADVFVLWKLALLQKRMLFFSPPPIGIVCYRVYCTTCLVRHHYKNITARTLKPYFYVNVADIEQLESETSYIACTTEKVFSEKPHLYDVYVDNRIVTSCNPSLKDILKMNRRDEEKYQQLLHLRYFSNLNNRIFGTVYGVARSDDRQLTSDHMISMGLDPKADKNFLLLLLETYDIDATLIVKDPCCPI